MKVLLIQPEEPAGSPFGRKRITPPIGLMYIAAVLEENGIGASILDNNLLGLGEQQLSRRIIAEAPDIVGISVDCIRFHSALVIASNAKAVFRGKVPVVMGGPHVNVRYENVIQYPAVDYVVYGEGEYTMLELCEAVAGKKARESIPGLAFKDHGEVKINPPRLFIANLDELPMPAYRLLPMKDYPRGGYLIRNVPVTQIHTSRGCPYDCAFCSNNVIWGQRFRSRSVESVLEEIRFHVEHYQSQGINFIEDCFTADRKRVIGICEGIKNAGCKIKFECQSRVDTVDRELLIKMREAGCESIWFGVESGNQKTLDMMNKAITLDQIRNAFGLCYEIGIKPGASIMLGIPYETIEEMKKTVRFTKEIKATYVLTGIFMGVPISRMYQEIIEKNWIDSAYGDILFVKTGEFNRDTIERFNKTFVVRELYFNPRGVFKAFRSKSPSDIPRIIKQGLSAMLQH